jgi:preprotein translocase subunit SecB
MTQQFKIRQVYLKDLSYQAPAGAEIFTREWSPKVKVDMKLENSVLSGALYEVVLTISVVTTSGDGTAYMIELMQAGIFELTGYDDAQRERLLGGKCANILFPYARETVEALLMKARLPALILDPIDFEAS